MEVVDFRQMASNDFAKLGSVSLEGLSNACIKHSTLDYLGPDYEPDPNFLAETNIGEGKPIRLRQNAIETSVYGIDTSNIVIGETREGILSAVRGSIVWRENGRYQYVRHGPFIFHITEENKYVLYNTLRQIYADAENKVGAPILEKAVERIRSVLERWLQKQLCEATHDSLLLWDGSLTTRTGNGSISVLSEMLRTARENRNYVLAISKKTSLSVSGRKLGGLLDDKLTPCLLDVDHAVRTHYGNNLRFFGRMYAAKLAPSPFTFRLDIDRQVSENEGFDAVSRLLANELLRDNYPETLRLAHVLSRFSASEVLAMQRYVVENYGLKIDAELDVRQVLFGPYGGSGQMWGNGQ